MQEGSLVEYIGGQDPKDSIQLEKGTPYTVESMGIGHFIDGWKPAIGIIEIRERWFWAVMFREIQPPVTSEEILEVLKETVVLQD